MQNNSQPYDASELSDDGSRKRIKADEVSIGGRFSDYLVPCHPYGDKHPKQREFEVNIFALMTHVFTSLSLVDHDCFRELAQDLDPSLFPVGISKLLRNLLPTKKQLVEKSVIKRLAEVKAVVISYDLWMSCKTEEILSLTAHYCTVRERENTHIGMPSTTTTDGVALSLSVMEVVENFDLEAKIVGITSGSGGNLRVCREALESKYTNDSVFPHPSPYSPCSALHIYYQELARQECNQSIRMMVKLTRN